MCGRYASQLPPDAIRMLFSTAGALPNLAPLERGTVAGFHGGPASPTNRRAAAGSAALPSRTPDLQPARKPINARSETAAGSGVFKAALASRHRLVPADAFYEWQARPDGKQPFAIARQDAQPLAFARLWEGWRGPEGEVVRSFAILTTTANATKRPLHERMPVILEPVDWPA